MSLKEKKDKQEKKEKKNKQVKKDEHDKLNMNDNESIVFHSYSSTYTNLNGKESEYSEDIKYADGKGYVTITKNGKKDVKELTAPELNAYLNNKNETHKKKKLLVDDKIKYL